MEVEAQSIDFSAGGYLRHRFMRAFTGAVLVFALAGGIVGAIFAALNLGVGWTDPEGIDLTHAWAITPASAAFLAFAVIWLRPRAPLFIKRMIAEFGAKRFVTGAVRALVIIAAVAATGASLWYGAQSLLVLLRYLGASAVSAAIILAGVIAAAIAVTILAALIQGLWRRLTGLVFFALFLLVGGGSFALIFSGTLPTEPAGALALAVVCLLVAGLVCLELAGQAFWQILAPKDGFYAARGWRPSLLRMFSAFRHSVGLPGFVSSFGRDRAMLTLMYLGVSLLNIGIVAVIAVPIGAALLIVGQEMFTVIGLLVIGAMAVAIAFAAWIFGGRFTRMVEARTTKLYQSVREWDTRAPIVFLRSYDHEAALLKARSIDPMLLVPAGIGRSKTLDNILLESGAPYGPVVAIGDPRAGVPPLGAARIYVPGQSTEWQPVVSGLCAAAQAIVICPSTTAGVRWELDLVQRHDIAKQVIYLANPGLSDEENTTLFEQIAPDVQLTLPKTFFGKAKMPIAAFHDPTLGWRVLATKRRSLQSYTIALNIALQRLLGVKGTRLARPAKPAKIKKAKKGEALPAVEPVAA